MKTDIDSSNRPFWILWTYIANYSERPIKVWAATPAAAVISATGIYSDAFRARASVYVFDREPVATMVRGEWKEGK